MYALYLKTNEDIPTVSFPSPTVKVLSTTCPKKRCAEVTEAGKPYTVYSQFHPYSRIADLLRFINEVE